MRAVAISAGRRLQGSTSASLLLATVAALAVGALLIVIVGVDPVDAYRSVWEGSVGSLDALAQTSLRMAPLLIMAVGLIPALRAGVFTIGSEGQFGIGALTAGLAVLGVAPHLPAWLAIVTGALAGAGGGLVWAIGPALLRAFLGIDEILTTFAFNFMATFLLLWLLNGPARGKDAFLVQTSPTPEDTWLPTLGDTVANIGLLLLPALVLAMVAFGRTPGGYRVRLYGAQPSLAAAAGARHWRVVVLSMLVAGAAAGIAGWIQIAGVDRAVFGSVFRGYGYLALALVALGRGQVAPTVLGAILFAGLQTGSEAMQLGVGISADFVFVMQGLVLYLMAFRGGRGREL
ncbi:MAG: ABC transporter permease [Actinobacteria bacterium]|nr:ABC transporter permease [Actinomycetota bacterium]